MIMTPKKTMSGFTMPLQLIFSHIGTTEFFIRSEKLIGKWIRAELVSLIAYTLAVHPFKSILLLAGNTFKNNQNL